MTNSADLDQLISSEANRSGSKLFIKSGYIRVQQDKESVSFKKHTLILSVLCNTEEKVDLGKVYGKSALLPHG